MLGGVGGEEKDVVVLRVTEERFQIGIGGEQNCRAEINVLARVNRCYKHTDTITTACEFPVWRKCVYELFRELFDQFHEVLTTNSQCYLCIPDHLPLPMRQAAELILEDDFRMKVSTISDMVTPHYTLGCMIGLLIQVDFRRTAIVPFAFGSLLNTYGTIYDEISIYSILMRTRDQLPPAMTIDSIQPNWLLCKVAPQEDIDATDCKVGKRDILAANSRWRLVEKFFAAEEKADIPRVWLMECIVDCIKMMEVSLRALVVQNVVISGWASDIPGLQERIFCEL